MSSDDSIESMNQSKKSDSNRFIGSWEFFAGIVMLAVAAFLFVPVLFPPALAATGSESEQFFFEVNESAGAPVLILALWLYYRRSHLADVLRGPGALVGGAATFGFGFALYAWAWFTGAPDLQILSLVCFLLATLMTWGGLAAIRAYWLPTAFLLFAMPISSVLVSTVVWPVQLGTAQYAGFILNAIGVDSFVQGDQILRPLNTFIVIETCSGLRSVVTLTMLTILLVDLFERRGRHAVLLVLLTPIIALLTNGIRVVTLVLNPHSDVASIHSLQGIVMLLVGLTVMYFLDGALEWFFGGDGAAGAHPDYGSARPVGEFDARRKFVLALPAIVLLACLGLRAVVTPWDAVQPVPKTVDALVQEALGDMRSEADAPDYKFRGGVHFRSWSRRVIVVDRRTVGLLVGLANPTNRKLSVYSSRLDREASGYEAIAETRVPLTEGSPNARRVMLRKGSTRVLSYSWYEPDSNLLVEFFRHALALDRSPFARPSTAVAIRLTTRIHQGETELAAEQRLRGLYGRIAPVVSELRQPH